MPALAQTSDSDSLNGYARPRRPPHRRFTCITQFDGNSMNPDYLSTGILEKVTF